MPTLVILFLLAVAGIHLAARPKVYAELEVIGWNVFEGHDPEAVKHQLALMIHNQNPDAFVLYEARNLYGHLHGLGYQVIQYKPKAKRKGDISNNGDVAILVRNNLTLGGRLALVMKKFWKGPKHGKPQDPRVYRWVRIHKGGRVWKLGGFHLPFGAAAKTESQNAIKAWFRDTKPGRPAIAVSDWNMAREALGKTIANPVGAKVAKSKTGTGIDMAAYRNCTLVSATSLGKHGSDHDAKRYVFRAAA